MTADEQEIRQLVSTWMEATKSGDVETVLQLMAEDVVFLRPGHEPMVGKIAFAAAAAPAPGQPLPDIDGVSEVLEVQVAGDWAWMWTKLSIAVTPPGATAPMRRAGHTLSVLKKQDGRWVLARDANLLGPA